jgi:hypothetical protein
MRSACAMAILALSACVNGGVSPSPPNPDADRSPSWVSPLASSANRLLYISDLGRWDVYMYAFPSLKVVGKLTGFNNPQGECADAAGNVWIANAGTAQMLEYAHGNIGVIASLTDPVGPPVGCAVDPATGDLAVMNLYDSSGAGSVLIYAKASGTPQIYSNSSAYSYYFGAYDRSGNLYVSGAASNGTYVLSTLAKGASSLSSIAIKGGTLYFPGTVAWRTSTLVLGDQECKKSATSCLYELSVSGKTAAVKRSVALGGSCDVAEAWVGATQIAAGNNGEYCGDGRSRVEIWPYPAGGPPSASISSPRAPVGTTVSVLGRP